MIIICSTYVFTCVCIDSNTQAFLTRVRNQAFLIYLCPKNNQNIPRRSVAWPLQYEIEINKEVNKVINKEHLQLDHCANFRDCCTSMALIDFCHKSNNNNNISTVYPSLSRSLSLVLFIFCSRLPLTDSFLFAFIDNNLLLSSLLAFHDWPIADSASNFLLFPRATFESCRGHDGMKMIMLSVGLFRPLHRMKQTQRTVWFGQRNRNSSFRCLVRTLRRLGRDIWLVRERTNKLQTVTVEAMMIIIIYCP